ncbi:toll/interleukin-1 receptor domain-containing protein [Microbacterium arborescens]|uniref:toll/interleukin-1 receptor domain-containing protein n=1 Tax=Microbacterium arborescens TaxID=33883 RepID=UPI000DF74A00|nr:toll/interleukin-1 receptor domain-containing protein [Microbacterium arborescens]
MSFALFWSYAHADDVGDRGRLLALAEHIRLELSLLRGTDVDLFVDADNLRWGDTWRERIENALDSSTFLVPVLTPRYFERPECRRELTNFYGQAQSRGLTKLVMPILYAPVAGLEEDSSDELLALCSRIQYFDWTSLRLADPDSERYRTAVSKAVEMLSQRWEEMRQAETAMSEAAGHLAEPAEWGLAEALEKIDSRLEAWLNSVEDDPVLMAQTRAVESTYNARIARSRRAQQLAIEIRMANEVLPLNYRALENAKVYSALSIEMSPYVLAAIRAAHDVPGVIPALSPLIDGLRLAQARIATTRAPSPGVVWDHDHWPTRRHLGAKFRELADVALEIKRFKDEGNDLVQSWCDEVEALGIDLTEPTPT